MVSRKPVQLANTDWDVLTTKQPRAQREQATSTEWDQRLTTLARGRHLAVAWWWGYRNMDGRRVAFCYVCDTEICEWNSARGMRQDQRDAVHEHSAVHYLDWKQRDGNTAAHDSPAPVLGRVIRGSTDPASPVGRAGRTSRGPQAKGS